MQQKQSNIVSQMKNLTKQFTAKDGDNFRKDYVSSQIHMSLAEQIKALRGDKTQEEFSAEIGKPQSVVCRLENHDAPKSIQSLLDIAYAKKIALLVRFVDFPTFLYATGDYSDTSMAPVAFDKILTNNFISPSAVSPMASAASYEDNVPKKGHNFDTFHQQEKLMNTASKATESSARADNYNYQPTGSFLGLGSASQ